MRKASGLTMLDNLSLVDFTGFLLIIVYKKTC
jgi:hypothetical protein